MAVASRPDNITSTGALMMRSDHRAAPRDSNLRVEPQGCTADATEQW
jgi:hypothetical protein